MKNNIRINHIFDKISEFYYSPYYFAVLILIASLAYNFKLEAWGIGFMVIFLCGNLIVNKDLLPSLMPLMLCGIFTMVHREQSHYYPLLWLAIPVAAAFIFHLIYYPINFKIKDSKMFFSMLAVAISITVGGFFSISLKNYFAMPGIFYVIGLGFGMFAVYIFLKIMINTDEKYDIKTYLPNMMTAIAVMMFIMLASYYIRNFKLLLTDFYPFFKQLYWGNNLSHSLLLTMPFAFYMSLKEKYSSFYFVMGIIEFICLVFSLSRGGMAFGSIMFGICIIVTLIKAGKNRKKFFVITAAFGLVILLGIIIKWDVVLPQIKELINITPDEARFGLYRTAIDNFLNNPVFGAGIGFIGEFFVPENGSMYWYHSTPFQIIGSLGIIGCIAYSWQFYDRMKITWVKKDNFNLYIFLAFLGFELYSLVNVGDFFPFPFVMILTEFFVILEKTNKMFSETL